MLPHELIPPAGFPLTVVILTFLVRRIVPVCTRPCPLDGTTRVVVIIQVIVAVVIVGIGAGSIIMPVLAPAVVLVGVFTVVVTAAVTVSQNTRYVEAKDRQENYPDHQGDG